MASRSTNGCGSPVADLGELRVLDEQRSGVDPEPGDAAVEPEAQHVLVLGPDVRVRPVEVGLLWGEQVQIPLAVRHARPGGAAEDRLPFVRRQLTVGPMSRPEPEPLTLGRAGPREEGFAEPRMLARDVVRDDVDDRADAERTRFRDQLLGLRERPEVRLDRPVVRDVVPRVGLGRGVPRVEPQGVDAELAEVRELRPDAGEIADAVSARVAEAADVDLVDDSATPPARIGVRRALDGLGFGDRHRIATIAEPTNHCKTRTKFAKFRTFCG